jgi:hypothetical protein
MRPDIRKTNSSYARPTGGLGRGAPATSSATSPSTPAAAGAPAPAPARSSRDSLLIEGIASQMSAFAEGLSAANRMCAENKAMITSSSAETKTAIEEGRAAALADSKAAQFLLQQQLDLKPATTSSLINPGNEAQYVWNCSILNILTVVLTALELNDSVEAKIKVRDGIAAIMLRNKHIKMADESPAGWGLIREYTKHAHAADDADDAKIRRCEATALAKQKKPSEATQKPKAAGRGRGRGGGAPASSAATTTLDPFTWALLQQSAQQYTIPTLPTLGQFAPAVAHAPKKLGPCFLCQGPHLAKDCPFAKAQNAAVQAHLASAIAAAPGNTK